MTTITVYDIEADLIEKLAEENDTTVAEIVEEAILCYMETMKEV